MGTYEMMPPLLNRRSSLHGKIIPYDDIYKRPCDWLAANAKRFHFTNDQIIAAAHEQFYGDHWSAFSREIGIYFLVCKKDIIYVGQSNNIAKRISQHRGNGILFDSMTWFEVPAFYIDAIEAYYIHRIKPPYNTAYPASVDYEEVAAQFD